MLKNYLKSAARNLLRYKTHSVINIVGLAIGLACCILIALYIRHELSYDRFFSNGDRLFRVTMSLTVNGKLDRSAGIEFPIAPLLRQFGWNDALGKKLKLVTAAGAPSGSVIGVVKDFHFLPLHKDIGPIVIYPGPFSYAAIKVRAARLPETLAFVETVWKEFEADKGFAYSFLNDILQENYRTEDRLGQLTTYFSGLAIFIACLGLLGLAAFTAACRTKEIGIRKVLGASMANLIGLLSKDFVKLVLVAFAIATPLAYFAMNKWLQSFAYRIDIGWWVFALAGGIALVIALLTVSTQAIKAALANPVEALRYE